MPWTEEEGLIAAQSLYSFTNTGIFEEDSNTQILQIFETFE